MNEIFSTVRSRDIFRGGERAARFLGIIINSVLYKENSWRTLLQNENASILFMIQVCMKSEIFPITLQPKS